MERQDRAWPQSQWPLQSPGYTSPWTTWCSTRCWAKAALERCVPWSPSLNMFLNLTWDVCPYTKLCKPVYTYKVRPWNSSWCCLGVNINSSLKPLEVKLPRKPGSWRCLKWWGDTGELWWTLILTRQILITSCLSALHHQSLSLSVLQPHFLCLCTSDSRSSAQLLSVPVHNG